ncbi:MAG: 16S rRNA (guanine(527)-N(7))-methyltransferase RsmG [Actinomycetes bacterium]
MTADVPRETTPGETAVSRETSEAPAAGVSRETSGAAEHLFGDRLPLAEHYAQLLTRDGVVRGLIGPREAGRLWERHLLNSAVVGELIATGAHVCDVGSGAGLPGLPLALARPDLQVELVEPLLRRASFLSEVLSELGLTNVIVTRARAEDLAGTQRADVVTARAVAPLPKLAGWCLPLLRPHGSLLALKGARAQDELEDAGEQLRRLGALQWTVVRCGDELLQEPTTVVRVVVGARPPGTAGASGRRGTKGAR